MHFSTKQTCRNTVCLLLNTKHHKNRAMMTNNSKNNKRSGIMIMLVGACSVYHVNSQKKKAKTKSKTHTRNSWHLVYLVHCVKIIVYKHSNKSVNKACNAISITIPVTNSQTSGDLLIVSDPQFPATVSKQTPNNSDTQSINIFNCLDS